jgi:DNA-binding SARP family transcriptional activator
MSTRLRTLGGLSLELAGGVTAGRSTQRKRLALLALLAASRNGGVSRDKLIAYLWPERSEDQSRHALSQALYALRRELGERSIVAGIDDLRLDHELVPSDVVQLNAAILARDLNAIVSLYAGPFLDGFFLPDAPGFEEWATHRREEYQRAYTDALEQLAQAALRENDPARAARWLQTRATVDPLNSQIALQLMQALAASGDRAGALRHFRTHRTLLQEEMQLDAPPELVRFAAECVRTESGQPKHPHAAPAQLIPAAEDTAAEATHRSRRARSYAPFGIATAALLSIAVLAVWKLGRNPDVTSQILLASVASPDTALGLAVREAFRAELEQTRNIRVLGDVVAAHTLELMRLSPSTRVDEQRALEVAHRRGIPFVVSASVHPIGSGAQIVARIIDVAGERTVATVTRRPRGENEVLAAVAEMASELRARVSEAGARRSNPLPTVTTASLPALRNYALARHAMASWDRTRALELAEAALVHDSAFAIAHYLAGDLLWYIDKQRHSDEHMERALDLAGRLPPREQLIVKGRYFQLVRDEPDSALVYWKLLADSYPDEPLAYEGMRWAYRALNRMKPMADASGRGASYDGAQKLNAFYDRALERLEAGDSAAGVAAMASINAAARGVYLWHIIQNRVPPDTIDRRIPMADRHVVALLRRDFGRAASLMDSLRNSSLQYYPRALLAQARMEWEFTRSPSARRLLDEMITWMENADLSAPAYARLAERAAESAIQMRDRTALHRLRMIIDQHDRGRNLRSYRFARRTIEAADAYIRGDYEVAIRESGRSPTAMFYARSLATTMLMRAHLLQAGGQAAEAQRLYRDVATQRFKDGDIETRALMAHIAQARLNRIAAAQGLPPRRTTISEEGP